MATGEGGTMERAAEAGRAPRVAGRGSDAVVTGRAAPGLSPALILTCPATPGVPCSPPPPCDPRPGPTWSPQAYQSHRGVRQRPCEPTLVSQHLRRPRPAEMHTPGSVPLAHPDLLGRATGGWGDSVGAGLTVPGPRATRGSGVQRWGLSTPPCHVPSQSELGLWGPNMSPRTGIRCDFFGQHHGSSGTKNKRGYFRVTLRRPFRV